MKASRWGGYAGYDGWFERANNAAFGVLGSLHRAGAGIRARCSSAKGAIFARFYAEVRRIAALPAAERRDALAR